MSQPVMPTSKAEALACDRTDTLAGLRDHFIVPDGMIYLDGHSLGVASHSALERTQSAARQEWTQGLIGSWNTAGWFDLPSRTAAALGPLIGGAPEDIIICDSVSVNLFKLATAALPLAGGEKVVMVERDEFPTDQYIAESLSKFGGAAFKRLAPGEGLSALERGGVLIKSVVSYRTGAVCDIAAHERVAAESGALIVWDLSHATGAVALDLTALGARIATGCTYKYLNGGPGAPAFVYVEGKLCEQMASPLSGWMGHADPFAFDPSYQPAPGIKRFAAGTPGILSLSALAGALSVFEGVEMTALSAKARALGDLCLSRTDALGFETISPGIGEMRGGHVSVLSDDGYPIVQALIARGIIADFRAPNIVRFGVSPLYVRFVDVWDAMDALEDIVSSRSWDQPQFHVRSTVT